MIDTKAQFEIMLSVARNERAPMTASAYVKAIAAVGLTQEAAGKFFGRSVRTGQGWALGETPVPYPVQACLEYMVAHGSKAVVSRPRG